jgi:hypothetical protein
MVQIPKERHLLSAIMEPVAAVAVAETATMVVAEEEEAVVTTATTVVVKVAAAVEVITTVKVAAAVEVTMVVAPMINMAVAVDVGGAVMLRRPDVVVDTEEVAVEEIHIMAAVVAVGVDTMNLHLHLLRITEAEGVVGDVVEGATIPTINLERETVTITEEAAVVEVVGDSLAIFNASESYTNITHFILTGSYINESLSSAVFCFRA